MLTERTPVCSFLRPLLALPKSLGTPSLNEGVPKLFGTANRGVKKLQTGVLSVNILYMLAFLGLVVLILLLLGVI